jgi:AcrR family transcriptional regulator
MRAVPDAARRTRMTASERREAILAAAMAVFGERGYHGASIDEIAQAAGISKALIYEHFASKKELHASLLDRYAGELFARLEANAATGTGGEQRLRGGMEAFFGFVEEHREAFRVLLRDLNDAEVVEALAGVQEQAVGVIAALMAADPDGAPAAADRDVEMLAAQLSGAVQSLANWWGEHRDVPRAVVVERAMQFAWTGLERLGARASAP